jgi:hypothetical protein
VAVVDWPSPEPVVPEAYAVLQPTGEAPIGVLLVGIAGVALAAGLLRRSLRRP